MKLYCHLIFRYSCYLAHSSGDREIPWIQCLVVQMRKVLRVVWDKVDPGPIEFPKKTKSSSKLKMKSFNSYKELTPDVCCTECEKSIVK